MSGAPIAVLTPMANPTVERELRRLLLPSTDYVVGRLVGSERNSAERLRGYAETLVQALGQFGGMEVSAIAFACTASSYLLGREGEARIAATLPAPILWAAATIRDELTWTGARRIAVVSPYPAPIHRAGLEYWREAGWTVLSDERVDIGSTDTRAIYALSSRSAVAAVARALAAGPDVVLLSGTGMPTLDLLDPAGSPPVISSNHCLARAMVAHQETVS